MLNCYIGDEALGLFTLERVLNIILCLRTKKSDFFFYTIEKWGVTYFTV